MITATPSLYSFLTFNGKVFVEQPKKMPVGGHAHLGEVHGLFKRMPNGTQIFRPNGELEAFLVDNRRHNEQFVVSASMTDAGPRYMHSTASTTETWLGIDTLGYMATHDAVVNEIFAKAADVAQLRQVNAAIESIREGYEFGPRVPVPGIEPRWMDIGTDEAVALAVRKSGYSVIEVQAEDGGPVHYRGIDSRAVTDPVDDQFTEINQSVERDRMSMKAAMQRCHDQKQDPRDMVSRDGMTKFRWQFVREDMQVESLRIEVAGDQPVERERVRG